METVGPAYAGAAKLGLACCRNVPATSERVYERIMKNAGAAYAHTTSGLQAIGA